VFCIGFFPSRTPGSGERVRFSIGALSSVSSHGRERYFEVKAIVKLIIFPKKLSRQLSSQLCDQNLSSRQLSSQFFFQKLCQGNCQVNCVTKKILQGNCQVNYLVKNYLIFMSIIVICRLILVNYGKFWSIMVNYR
jgi:hypothetical protein